MASLATLFETLLFCVLGCAGYLSLGDKYMNSFYLLRQPYPNEQPIIETVYRVFLGLFFVLGSLAIAAYNPTMRDYMIEILNLGKSKKAHVFASLFPFACCCLLAFLIPNVVNIFSIAGATVCNFNGYILPSMMTIKLNRMNGASKKIILFECLRIGFFTSLGALALIYTN